jgi:hypothetical protein
LVVWSQLSLITSRWEIWGRIIDWNNAGTNSPFLIASWVGLNLDYPKVAYNAYRNEYMVVWQTSQASSGVLTGIGRRRVSNTGTSLTTAEYVTGSGSTNQGSPDIDYNLAGDNYLVAWVEPGPVSKPNIYTGLLDYQGSVPVSKQQLSSNYQAFEQQRPAVASNNSYGFMVVFNVDAPPDIDIYGREVLINGTVTDTTYLIAIYAGIDEKNPAIASGSGSTDYFIIFENETLNGTAIKAVHWDPGISYSEIELAPAGMGDNTNPAVEAGTVGMLAAYEWDSFSPTDDKDIYGRVFWQEVVYLPLVMH